MTCTNSNTERAMLYNVLAGDNDEITSYRGYTMGRWVPAKNSCPPYLRDKFTGKIIDEKTVTPEYIVKYCEWVQPTPKMKFIAPVLKNAPGLDRLDDLFGQIKQ